MTSFCSRSKTHSMFKPPNEIIIGVPVHGAITLPHQHSIDYPSRKGEPSVAGTYMSVIYISLFHLSPTLAEGVFCNEMTR